MLADDHQVDGWMRLNWTDEYLTWSPEDFQGLTQIHFSQVT